MTHVEARGLKAGDILRCRAVPLLFLVLLKIHVITKAFGGWAEVDYLNQEGRIFKDNQLFLVHYDKVS